MYLKQYIQKITVALLLTSLVLLSACDKDDDVSTRVELLSFGPAGVQHGGEIRFIGNNLNKVTSIILPGVTIDKTAFTQQTNELIVFTVPETAESGKVTLVTPEGNIESKGSINFEVPVIIESVPGTARPGEEITISGQFMNWVNEVRFADDVVVTEFVSKTVNELKLIVPMQARTGTLVFSSGGTEPLTIETEEEIGITLPIATTISPNPAERGQEITITGTDLDLTYGLLFKGVADTIRTFISQTGTEIKLLLPEAANKGPIGVLAHSGVVSESADALQIVGDLPPLEALAVVFYSDGLENGWQKWGGWGGGSSDLSNNENVRDGDLAIKAIFAADWGASLQMGGGNTSTTGHTEVSFAIFGTAGTLDREVEVLVNSTKSYSFKLVEGEWTEAHIPLSAFDSPATIGEFSIRAKGWAGTVYIDHIGLR